MPSSTRVPERVVWAVEQLALTATDHVLEIGCGPGHAVALLCSALERGTVTAIDRSALQVEKARALNREHIMAGRARIESMTLAAAPAAFGRRFSKVLAVNVNAFWTQAAASSASLRGLLRARGRVYLVYEAPSAAGLKKLRVAVPELLVDNGFRVDEVRLHGSKAALCVVARMAGRS